LTETNVMRREANIIRKVQVKVPRDYDKTDHTRLARWDEHILDEDIVRIIRMIYNPRPGRDFANSGCPTVDAHFTAPFSNIAKNEFGYGM
jgi:hypothetical protein